MYATTILPRVDSMFVEVPGTALEDLCDLVDQAVDLMERKEPVPAPLVAGMKGAAAEIRCHTRAGVPA